MSFGYAVNTILARFGVQLVRKGSLERLIHDARPPAVTLPPAVAPPPAVTPPPVMTRPPITYGYLGDGIGITLTHDLKRIFVYTRDRWITPHLIMSGEWERQVETVVRRLTRPGTVAVEVGANMGYHTLTMASALGPAGRLYTFEANPEMHDLLCSTLAVNGLLDRAVPLCLAAADRKGAISFCYHPKAVGGGMINAGGTGEDAVRLTVDAVTLDEQLGGVSSVSMLRMDCEGAEPLVLAGARRILQRSPDIRIVSEWSVAMMNSNAPVEGLVRNLVAQGFRFWKIHDDASLVPLQPTELPNLPHCDVVMSRGEIG